MNTRPATTQKEPAQHLGALDLLLGGGDVRVGRHDGVLHHVAPPPGLHAIATSGIIMLIHCNQISKPQIDIFDMLGKITAKNEFQLESVI